MISVVVSDTLAKACEPTLRAFGKPFVFEKTLFTSAQVYDFAILEFPQEDSLGRLWGARSQGLVFPALLIGQEEQAASFEDSGFLKDKILLQPFTNTQFYDTLCQLWNDRRKITEYDCSLFNRWFERPLTQLVLLNSKLNELIQSLH